MAEINTLAERIIKYRAVNRISQGEFAKMCGLSTQTVSSIELGYQRPSKLTVMKISLVLDGGGEDEAEHKQD